MSSKFLDKTGMDTLWAKIKSTFQTLGNLVTAWGSTPSDTKYPSEKLVKTALDGKVPGTALSVSVPASSTRYVKMVVPSGYHHYLVFFNASQGVLHAEWLFRSYGDGGTARTSVNYIGALVTARKWYVAGSSGNTFYIEFVNTSTGSQSLNFKVCALDISALPTLTVESSVPSGYVELGVVGTVASRLLTARNLAVSLSNTSTDTPFDGHAAVTNIKTTGTLGVANGGTGKTTAKAAEYNLTTGKSEISDTTSGDDRVVFELASPSESNGVTRGFRKLSTIWTWIKGLLSSESGVNISGNAATATTAAGYTSGGAIDTALQGKVQPGDLATVATSGSYNDLSDKPSIPAAQVQSDWSQTNSQAVDYIKNKPRSGFISISGGSFLKLYVPANVNVGHASFRVDTSNSGSQMVAILSFRNNDGTTDRIALKNLSCGTESHQFVEGAYKVDSNGKYFYLYMGNSGTHNVTWQFTGASRNSIEVSSIPMADVPLDATAITSNSYVPMVVSLPSSPGVGSASIPVYVDTSGRIVAGTKPVQVVNSIDSLSMVSDVLYVM